MSTERLETLVTPVLHVRTCYKLVTQVRVLLDHLYRQLLQASDITRRKSVFGDDESVPVVSFDFLFAEDCPRWSIHFTLQTEHQGSWRNSTGAFTWPERGRWFRSERRCTRHHFAPPRAARARWQSSTATRAASQDMGSTPSARG